mmetsp:Transcript_4867/g.17126  ORF Transcript_4867/g.17126 Transcript_4867/m.17126 type:complete len:316 (+) Transcript_4867:53-1000(+)
MMALSAQGLLALLREDDDGLFDVGPVRHRLVERHAEHALGPRRLVDDAHVEAEGVEALHLRGLYGHRADEARDVALDRLLVVVVHVRQDGARKGREAIDLRGGVLCGGDGTRAREPADKGNVEDVVHAIHVEVTELGPEGARMRNEVRRARGGVFVLVRDALHLAREHGARVRRALESLLRHRQRRPRVHLDVLRVAGHARKAKDGAADVVDGEAHDGTRRESLDGPRGRERAERGKAVVLRDHGADLIGPGEARAALLVRADLCHSLRRDRVHLGHALDDVTAALLRVLLLIFLLKLRPRHRVRHLRRELRQAT